MSTCRWYSSWEISSAAASADSYSAAIHTSAASSTIFLPIACTPASSWATVPDPSGRSLAFAASSANSASNVFTLPGYRTGAVTDLRVTRQASSVDEDAQHDHEQAERGRGEDAGDPPGPGAAVAGRVGVPDQREQDDAAAEREVVGGVL